MGSIKVRQSQSETGGHAQTAGACIRANGHAQVIIERGRIEASNPRNGIAIDANQDATVVAHGATIVGKVTLGTAMKAHVVVETRNPVSSSP